MDISSFPILSLIIFLPLAYMPGIVGRFLKSYGLTVAFSILISLFVSFTLTPKCRIDCLGSMNVRPT